MEDLGRSINFYTTLTEQFFPVYLILGGLMYVGDYIT